MGHRRLSEVEKDLNREERAAQSWATKHRGDVDRLWEPSKSNYGEQVMMQGRRRNRIVPLGEYGNDHDEEVYDEGARFVPLLSKEQVVNLRVSDIAARVRHVLGFVSEKQRQLLNSYYVEGLSWQELRRGDESRQAVHDRLMWSRNAFHKMWLKHAEDDIALEEGDI